MPNVLSKLSDWLDGSSVVTVPSSTTQPVSGTVTTVPSSTVQPVSGTVTTTPSSTTQPVSGTVAIGAGTAAIGTVAEVSGKLGTGAQAMQSITCTSGAVDYSGATSAPAGTVYADFFCAKAAQIAFGEATSTSVGKWIGAGIPTKEPVTLNGDSCPHAQVAVADSGATVYVTYRGA